VKIVLHNSYTGGLRGFFLNKISDPGGILHFAGMSKIFGL
jgi:hypothetical protein